MPQDVRRGTVAVYQRMVLHYRRPFFELAAERLQAEGYRLVVISGDEEAPASGRQNLEYRANGSHLRRTVRSPGMEDSLVVTRRLSSTIRELQPSVVVTEDLSAFPSNLIFPLRSLFGGAPYLIWSLGPSIIGNPPSLYRKALAPLIAAFRSRAAGMICYSSWAAERYREMYDKPVWHAPNSTLSRSEVVEEGALDLGKFADLPPLTAVFMGRVLKQKRLENLLRAISALQEEVRLQVIGDGPELPHLRQLADELGIGSKIVFYGAVYDPAQKRRLMQEAQVAVLPGRGGLFIQEAQALGLPVVAGEADGTEQDLVRAATPELYLPDAGVDTLAAALRRCASSPQLLREASIAVSGNIRSTYNLETMADRWVEAAVRTASWAAPQRPD